MSDHGQPSRPKRMGARLLLAAGAALAVAVLSLSPASAQDTVGGVDAAHSCARHADDPHGCGHAYDEAARLLEAHSGSAAHGQFHGCARHTDHPADHPGHC